MSHDQTVIRIQTSRFTVWSRGGLPPFPTVRVLPGLHGYYDGSDCPTAHPGQAPIASDESRWQAVRLSQVSLLVPCNTRWVAPLGRIRTFPVRRMSWLASTPVASPFTRKSFRMEPHSPSYLMLTVSLEGMAPITPCLG